MCIIYAKNSKGASVAEAFRRKIVENEVKEVAGTIYWKALADHSKTFGFFWVRWEATEGFWGQNDMTWLKGSLITILKQYKEQG